LFSKKTIKDVDLKNKRVLLRADYSVPVKNGIITDDYRIKQSLPTINYILEQQPAALVIISHMGRPNGPEDKDLSLAPAAESLSGLLSKQVKFAPDCVGEMVKRAAGSLKPGEILLLENLRFHPEEKKNDETFAKAIVEVTGAEAFVQDGFGVVHRNHASTVAVTKLLPSVAGLLLELEINTITKAMEKPNRPLIALVGGAKISDKIDVLTRLINIADCVAVAGAMANNFLVAEGVDVGKSLIEPEIADKTKEILHTARLAERERDFNFLVPVDAVVSKKMDGTAPTRIVDLTSHTIYDIQAYPKMPPQLAYSVGAEEMIMDIGPVSAAYIAGAIKMTKTVIWNGPCGVTETKGIAGARDPFAHGTGVVVEAMIGPSRRHQNRPFTLVGGGDTAGYVQEQGIVDEFGFVSTGGGASLELMASKKLPGIEALLDKHAT